MAESSRWTGQRSRLKPAYPAKKGGRRFAARHSSACFASVAATIAMYIPQAFRVEEPSKLVNFMQQHSFATLVTSDASAPFASHLPMVFRPEGGDHGTLVSHMARANPQWQH